MKTLLLTLAIASSFNAVADTSIILGGWSSHQTKDTYNFNEVHNAVGIVHNDYIVTTFKNSYYNQSVVVAKQFNFTEHNFNELTVSTSIALGVVSGYTEKQLGAAYIGSGISAYVLPTVSVKYNDFGVDFGVIPASDGFVATANFRIYF